MTDYFVRKNNSSFYIRKAQTFHIDYSDYSYNENAFYVSSAQPGGSLVLSVDADNSTSYPGTGTAWYDLAAPSNDLTLSYGGMYTTTYGSAMLFNGAEGVYDNNYNGYLNFGTDSFSILLWTRIAGNLLSFHTILNIGTYENGVILRWNDISSPDSLYIAGTAYDWNSTVNLPLNEWTQIAIVKSGTNVKLYVGDTLVVDSAAPASVNPSQGLLLGYSAHNSSEFYTGYISLLKVYRNAALTASQISSSLTEMNTRYGL
jgi:hypothetical protein